MEGKTMSVLLQTIMFLLMVALVMGLPVGSNTPPVVPQTPSVDGLATPVIPGSDQQLPPGGGLLPPLMPGDGVVPPLIPSDGLIPSIGGIDLPKRKCAGKCGLQCMRSKRNRFAAKICTTLCMIRCGIRRSNFVYSCTKNCANFLSPNSISDDRQAQIFLNSGFERCKTN